MSEFCEAKLTAVRRQRGNQEPETHLVEISGLEPLTPCVQGRCSTN